MICANGLLSGLPCVYIVYITLCTQSVDLHGGKSRVSSGNAFLKQSRNISDHFAKYFP